MTYQIVITPPGARSLNRLRSASVRDAVLTFVYGDLVRHPERVGGLLGRDRAGQFAARRADYRILYTVSGATVHIVQVDHRSDAYRPT